ncbi:hypothetical protein PENSPDRAFT_741294 [Peniophora sp. CONT]|nr:hypothetical protein PENSPDRAFT_741294 [Peniophora sp. CONT]
MLQICRAEDGESFQVNATHWDIEKSESLENFLHEHTGVDPDAVLAYLSDGRRLGNDNVRELAGAPDQTIYVFNKFYLDDDLEHVLQELWLEPPLQPSVRDEVNANPSLVPAQIGALYLRAARANHQSLLHLLASLRVQLAALRIASGNLDKNVLDLSDVYDGVAAATFQELERQNALLAGIDADLNMIDRVDVHRQFLSATMQRAIDQGEKGRTLADYVARDKMRQVAQTCTKVHTDLRQRQQSADQSMKRLTDGSADIRLSLSESLIHDGEGYAARSQELCDKSNELVMAFEDPIVDSDKVLLGLRQVDADIRDLVERMTTVKNRSTEQTMRALRHISVLNNDLVQLPDMLASLQTTLRTKNAFTHIQRLHNMIYAYGATLIEIVRRKEFARFFYQRAQLILEVMAKLSNTEKKRRQIHRGEFHGQLPFDLKGMDDAVASIDFTPMGSSEGSMYNLQRSDVDDFMRVLSDLEAYVETLPDGSLALASLREIKTNLDKLVQKMDALESGFDRIAERSLLSSSKLALSRRRLSDADSHALQDLTNQLRDAENEKALQSARFEAERAAVREEMVRLRSQVDGSSGQHELVSKLERDLHLARSQLENETRARQVVEGRHQDLLANVDRQRQELSDALNEATTQTRAADIARQELAQARAEFEEIKALEARSSARLSSLLEVQETTQRSLEAARARDENLETQFNALRDERESIRRALDEAGKEKDRLLRQQASEHDRQMRDYVAEADGDRAVLEHQFCELRAEIEDMERQVKEANAQVEMKEADATGLREELHRLEVEMRNSQEAEAGLRTDLKEVRASAAQLDMRLENANRLVAQLLDTALAYRTAHFKALNVATAAVSHPAISKSLAHLNGSPPGINGSRMPLGPLDEPSPIDPADPAGALEALRAFDQDHFLEAVAKTASTIRKWQKQCKEYRERSKGKISFRNFAKGDLALFLPTRNSVSKPWAAFNVSFPHYFLQATGHLAEQLKNREWIVARITSITERVVDHKDPTSNPYGLGDGIKYYMLEVEDWTQPVTTKRRAGPRRISSGETNPDADSQVEEIFPEARGPSSHLFPSRSRSNSIPIAGPSSLSKLLAQASVTDGGPTTAPRTPSPLATPFVPPSASPSRSPAARPPSPPKAASTSQTPFPTSPPVTSQPHTALPSPPSHPSSLPRRIASSPLRPASRASRLSTSSGRIPPFAHGASGPATVKGIPTTALSTPAPASPPVVQDTSASTPSPADSPGEGMMASVLSNARRRTTSYHAPASSTPSTSPTDRRTANVNTSASTGGAMSALASIASWSQSLSRKKRQSLIAAPAPAAVDRTAPPVDGGQSIPASGAAQDQLSRYGETTK